MSNNTNHTLIPPTSHRITNGKILSIHSEDRDICKWPYANNFAVELPETYTSVTAIYINNVTLPNVSPIFSNEYQNTKLAFTLFPKNPYQPWYAALAGKVNDAWIIEIQEGIFTPQQLVTEIQNKMNDIINDFLKSQGVLLPYLNFKVHYDSVANEIYFGNLEDSFTIKASTKIPYTVSCEQPDVYCRHTRWGLPWNLGFDKNDFPAYGLLESNGDKDIIFYYNDMTSPDYVWLKAGTTAATYVVKAPSQLKLQGDKVIYMEIDKYNYVDELEPYSKSTTSLYNNDFGGKVNSSFVVIPVNGCGNSTNPMYYFDSTNILLYNCGIGYNPPIERISRLKFKFRYHDGRLVDFKDTPIHFTLEFNQLNRK